MGAAFAKRDDGATTLGDGVELCRVLGDQVGVQPVADDDGVVAVQVAGQQSGR